MNFIKNLAIIYDEIIKDGIYPDGLFPIGYISAEVQLEIKIDENSNFISANFVSNKLNDQKKKDSTTLIPITEKSQSRTNAPSPNMFFDDLRYLAGDLNRYSDKDYSNYHNLYMNQLQEFLNSKYANKYVQIVFNYLQKNKLITDLVINNILIVDDKNLLKKDISEYTKDDKPVVFQYCNKNNHNEYEQCKLNVRFIIVPQNGKEINLANNNYIIDSFSKYYISTNNNGTDIDYNTGEIGKSGTLFPKKIRNTADSAKLISSNDSSTYTFRGIFENAEEAMSINQIISDKAHNALRYLIKNQGIRVNDKIILIYGNKNNKINYDFINDSFTDFFPISESVYDSYDDYAYKVKLAIKGYEQNLNIENDAFLNIVILDAMTPGRLSVNYYREYYGEEIKNFVYNIEKWYEETLWYKSTYDNIEKKYINSYGTNTLREIALSTCGVEGNNYLQQKKKVLNKIIESLMMSLLNNRKINYSIVSQLTYKAQNPQKYKIKNCYQTVLKSACQINRKYYNDKFGKEVIKISMDNQNKEINYQLGRLLAVMELIETTATQDDKHKETNVKKYFSKFFAHPMKTYEIIYQKIIPYEKKLKSNYLLKLRQEIINNIDPNAFCNIKKLDGRALCGYDAQISEYYMKKNKESENENEN